MAVKHVEDARSSEDRIIAAALTLINERGLGGVTMSGIADSAGVARQTLYNHYPDVDSIVAAAISRHNRDAIELLDSSLAVAGSSEEELEQLVRHVVTVGAHAGHNLDVQYGLAAGTRATLSAYGEKVYGHIHEILTAGVASGSFRPDLVPAWDAVLVQQLLSGISQLAGRSPDEAAAIAATGIRTVLAAVVPR